jgi:hypothetical protein
MRVITRNRAGAYQTCGNVRFKMGTDNSNGMEQRRNGQIARSSLAMLDTMPKATPASAMFAFAQRIRVADDKILSAGCGVRVCCSTAFWTII